VRTDAPLYGLIVTRPAPARVLSASRTGVLETPSCAASSVSINGWPGLSRPVRIACLTASSTASVREGTVTEDITASGMGKRPFSRCRIGYLIYDPGGR
jgi:hypothetical protein